MNWKIGLLKAYLCKGQRGEQQADVVSQLWVHLQEMITAH